MLLELFLLGVPILILGVILTLLATNPGVLEEIWLMEFRHVLQMFFGRSL